jgi:exodeoxyribonuclease VII large subunit
MLDPRAIMAKDFALVKRQGGHAVRSAKVIKSGEIVSIHFHDGEVSASGY